MFNFEAIEWNILNPYVIFSLILFSAFLGIAFCRFILNGRKDISKIKNIEIYRDMEKGIFISDEIIDIIKGESNAISLAVLCAVITALIKVKYPKEIQEKTFEMVIECMRKSL